MLPFSVDEASGFAGETGDYIYVPDARAAVEGDKSDVPARLVHGGQVSEILLHLPRMTEREREIILDGCLMNWYAAHLKD